MRGGDIEKIEKECWSGLVDCLSLLQICYFYINNPLVMKAIPYCFVMNLTSDTYMRKGGNFCSGHKDHLSQANK